MLSKTMGQNTSKLKKEKMKTRIMPHMNYNSAADSMGRGNFTSMEYLEGWAKQKQCLECKIFKFFSFFLPNLMDFKALN